MRKIVLNLAISLDGYISEIDGDFDWIRGDGTHELDTDQQFTMPEFIKNIDTVVMGAKAYEDCGITDIADYQNKCFFVATTRTLKVEDNVEVISGDICSKIESLKEEEGKDIWLFGGGGLTDGFIKKNIVDEYIIGIIPVILGKGRKLFYGDHESIKLRLVETTITEGIVILRYVKR